MTLADVSDVVRDALALRRWWQRRELYTGFPEVAVVKSRFWGPSEDAFYPRLLGMPAYIPDGPLPLPSPQGGT